jgi:hypothetical protein
MKAIESSPQPDTRLRMMKKTSLNMAMMVSVLCLALSTGAVLAQDDKAITADAIVAGYVAGNESKSEMAYVKMMTETPGAPAVERRILLAFQKGEPAGESFFMRLLHPKDVEGVTLLATTSATKELSYYFLLPALGKMRQLTPEARQGAFLGSDYTFEDLLQEVPEAHDYKRLPDDEVDGAACYVVRAVETKKEKESAYAFRDLFIEKGNYNLRKVAFYNGKESLVKLLTATGYDSKEVKGRTTRPQKAVMESVETKTRTTFTVIEGRVDQKIDAELFTPKKLENWPLLDVEEFIFDLGMSIEVN